MPELSIIVFAVNEQQNVQAVLGELRTWLTANVETWEIVFVDDGSTDGTPDAARTALRGCVHRVIQHGRNRGIGAAIKSGVSAANGDWVTFLPADGQIAPEAVGTLLTRAKERGDDVVFSVYDHRDDGLDRKLLSAGVRALIAAFHGVRLRSDGPYLFRRRLFVPEELQADTFFLNFEFPIGAMRSGLRTSVVTIACRPRLSGQSKSAKLGVVVAVGKELLALRLRRTRTFLERYRA